MTEIEKKLLALAAESANLSVADVLSSVGFPNWAGKVRMYDWRNHLNDDLQVAWNGLDLETRLALFLTAMCEAQEEDWDFLLAD